MNLYRVDAVTINRPRVWQMLGWFEADRADLAGDAALRQYGEDTILELRARPVNAA